MRMEFDNIVGDWYVSEDTICPKCDSLMEQALQIEGEGRMAIERMVFYCHNCNEVEYTNWSKR